MKYIEFVFYPLMLLLFGCTVQAIGCNGSPDLHNYNFGMWFLQIIWFLTLIFAGLYIAAAINYERNKSK